jgi:hypothetical protein
MPYLGNPVVDRFTSTKAASVYSGDGSTVAFTLEHSVGSDEDILVSVDGVIQEPSVAYAVSSGTTLTFTAAPSNNAGNNIFVYYLFRTIGTVTHPPTSALSATSGTFSGNVTIGDASAADKKILFDGNAQDFHIGLDDSTDSLTIGLGSALGTTTSMVIDANGIITKPLQPAFLATLASEQSNIAVNSAFTILFATEIFDQNADFDTSTYTFTAPVTGRYQLNATMMLVNTDSAATYYQINIVTSNRIYYHTIDTDFGQDAAYFSLQLSALADMDASDTAKVTILQAGGTAQTDINAVSAFSGYLVA